MSMKQGVRRPNSPQKEAAVTDAGSQNESTNCALGVNRRPPNAAPKNAIVVSATIARRRAR